MALRPHVPPQTIDEIPAALRRVGHDIRAALQTLVSLSWLIEKPPQPEELEKFKGLIDEKIDEIAKLSERIDRLSDYLKYFLPPEQPVTPAANT